MSRTHAALKTGVFSDLADAMGVHHIGICGPAAGELDPTCPRCRGLKLWLGYFKEE